MDDLKIYYEILGVDPGASFEEVKRAFRNMAKVWYPDRFLNDPRLQTKAQEKFKEIIHAYKSLSIYYRYLDSKTSETSGSSQKSSEDNFQNRKLCRDGTCIGIIDENGFCKICGKPYESEAIQTAQGSSTSKNKDKNYKSPPKVSYNQRKSSTKNLLLRRMGIVGAICIIFALLVYFVKEEPKKPPQSPIPPRWISIKYEDLIDKSSIIRTGESLGSSITNPNLRGALQPFLDKYSYLLQYAVEMIYGPDAFPHRNIVDYFPVGSKQPAWVSIFRGGRIFLTTDSRAHARIFLMGEDPKSAYNSNYSIIRHCLSGLLPEDSSALKLEVFAFKNDYQTSELKINLNPFSLEAKEFPPPANSIPLDLTGLDDFFEQNGQLEGGELDHDKGLILYAKKGAPQTLAGNKLELSDFVVAYRSVFHAGDNDAFVSLDRHKDPTKVMVNFGGLLEDTKMGRVILEADKRFKTISCGFDPNSLKDVRNFTRTFIPSFLTEDERDLERRDITNKKWVGTRFWFYPDSIQIESDLEYKYAYIAKPQFLADAERSKDDFNSLEEFEKKKKTTLSPSILESITHLNANYSQYEKAYPELRELTTVARLMAICIWLHRAKANWLDLDSLLSLELPPFRTEREKSRLLACSTLGYASEGFDNFFVQQNTNIHYLAPFLDRKLSETFKNANDFSSFLCIESKDKENCIQEAGDLFKKDPNQKLREVIRDEKELQGIVIYLSNQFKSLPRETIKLTHEIESDKRTLAGYISKIENIEIELQNVTDRQTYNSLVDEHNRLVREYELIRNQHNQRVSRLNESKIHTRTGMSINGGINLTPRNFKIARSSSSARLNEFRNIARRADINWKIIDAGSWIRSKAEPTVSSRGRPLPKLNWIQSTGTSTRDKEDSFLEAGSKVKYWLSRRGKNYWRDFYQFDPISRERSFDAQKGIINVADFKDGKIEQVITGNLTSGNGIVFSKSIRHDLIVPKGTPFWFEK